MKILLVIPHFPPPEIGGGDVVYKALVGEYKKLGHDVSVLFGDQTEKSFFKLYSEFQKDEVSFYKFPLYPTPSFAKILSTVLPINIFASFQIKKILKKINPDLIHIHGYGLFMPAQVAKVCYKLDYKYIFTIHGAPISPAQMKNPIISLAYNFYKIFFGNPLLKNADRITAVSSYAANFPEFKKYRDKIEVIFNGINKDEYIKPDFNIYENLGINKKENTRIILSLGRIEWIKGFDKVIKLLPEMIKAGYDPIYCIAGRDNGEKENLERLSKDLGVADRIKYLGFLEREDKLSALFNCDIIAVPSLSETFSISALEGRIVGKNILTTFNGGITSALKNYKSSYFLENWSDAFLEKENRLDEVSDYYWNQIAPKYLVTSHF
jgi:glycosyltransferase involved in cell wall biosynthesis